MHRIREWLRSWFGPPARPPARPPSVDLDAMDRLLTDIEAEQQYIEARLSLLERQADPRGWQRHG